MALRGELKKYVFDTKSTKILQEMKPARGPQTEFFSNSCSGIPGLANYEVPNEVC